MMLSQAMSDHVILALAQLLASRDDPEVTSAAATADSGMGLIRELGSRLVGESESIPLRDGDLRLMEELGVQLIDCARDEELAEADARQMKELGQQMLGATQGRAPAPRPEEPAPAPVSRRAAVRIGALSFRVA